MTDADLRTRRIRNLVEPIAGVAFFAAEVHRRYVAFGFEDPGGEVGGVRRLDWSAYFVARAACLGEVRGEVAASAFGVFPYARVANAVDAAWQRTDAASMLAARLDGTVEALDRLVGAPAADLDRAAAQLDRALDATASVGRPLFAGLRSLPVPDTAAGRFWRLCDQFREHRMDAHVAALAAAAVNGCEACLLNDLRQGLGLGTYVFTRGWTVHEVDAAVDSLRTRGLLDGDGLGAAGFALREEIEAVTDAAQSATLDALGDLDRFEALVAPWRQRIIDGFGYPGRRTVEQLAAGASPEARSV